MKETIDVFEILKHGAEQNQEQSIAPDFDLFDAIRHIGAPAPKPAPAVKPLPESAPAPKPAPAVKPEFESAPKPEPAPKSAPAPAAKPAPEPKSARDSKRAPVPRPDRKPRSRRILKLVIKVAAALTVLILLTAFVVSGFIISGNSMAPAISKGDIVIVNKMVKSYHIGDVIMFRDGGNQKHFLRIAATEGDLLDIRKDGKLYINSSAEEENYVTGETLITDENLQYPVLISEKEYFLLGDNRENSTDSRDYQIGTVHESEIVGKVIFCIKKIK